MDIRPFPFKPPSHLPLHPTPLGCHRALGLGSLHHTANSHQLSVLHMVMYMFQCHSLNSSQPLLPPLCPKVFMSVKGACLDHTTCPSGKSFPPLLVQEPKVTSLSYIWGLCQGDHEPGDPLRMNQPSPLQRRGWTYRLCHTEWRKSEREKQISCINTYMWNLEKNWYGWKRSIYKVKTETRT